MLSAGSMLLVFLLSQISVQAEQPVFVHYMPWYASKPVSGQWGWHWTMGHFNPDKRAGKGIREAATHDPPVIGLYDSNDPDVLECQVLLMKLAGIEGVIIDWYGITDFRDYGIVHRNTQHLVKFVKRAGLKFAICYEDQTLKHLVEGKQIPASQVMAQGKSVMGWLDEHWFDDEAYLQVDGKPLLLVFGPQYLNQSQWKALRTGLKHSPLICGLPHLVQPAGLDGLFVWPPVSGGKTVTPEMWRKRLTEYYARAPQETVISVAFPGFHDIYQQAGLHESYGAIDARDGKTLQETLQLAAESKTPLIQVATWNDYGEGTVVEPQAQGGYRNLEIIRSFVGARSPRKVSGTARDLRLPVLWYRLKKQYAGEQTVTAKLDEAAALLLAGDIAPARRILEEFRLDE